ncbi:DUF6090 family protein [Flavobacteriaceae bacterium S0825]|uniref:DUF6090 family protein n=1 Tax=Gaetbulibacter sp. S0825 TaxID=2720084 RepID=UPI001431BE80|nr:DUF6090 family protein [Gaetbulibacter sp. S0825]MCK0110383.1 DUF6090 family protein [Flavobacteriaceae bacterium S0825]NIX66012.1 hypothetical protein [Gaetbulibacter sp. S0825]
METRKTSKYFKYAIGEIILVMIGILLALQVNSWNQMRLDRIEEKTILSNLHSEFQENKILSTQNINLMKGAMKANKDLMALMGSSGDELQKHNLDSLFYSSLPAAQFTASEQSISNIIQGGRMNIIRNQEIKKLLYQWQAQLDAVEIRERALDNWSYQQILPIMSKYISFKEMDANGNYDWAGKSKLKKTYDPLFQSLEYENLLDNFLFLHLNNLQEIEKANIIITQILDITKPYTK